MRLLSKDKPKVPKFAPDEGLEVNTNFKYNLVKVNFIPKVVYKKKHLQKMTDIENKIKEEIKSERALVLDAMIVRIMKARKKESHTELITEVIKQIFLFKPQPQMIKQSIERLTILPNCPPIPKSQKNISRKNTSKDPKTISKHTSTSPNPLNSLFNSPLPPHPIPLPPIPLPQNPKKLHSSYTLPKIQNP